MNKIDLKRLNWAKLKNSPGTPGTLLKAYEDIDGIQTYYKLSSYDQIKGIIGHESINEVIVDRLLTILNIEHVSYELIYADVLINNKIIETYLCSSLNFRKMNESKQAIDTDYLLNRKNNESKLDYITRLGFEKEVYLMFVVDFIIINRDRHGANIEILKDSKNKTLRLSPLFDHGLSLLFSCNNDKDIDSFNVLEDIKVQSYFGSNSLYDNLKLIPPNKLPQIKKLNNKDKDILFKDIDSIMSSKWINKIWDLINKRIEYYENFRNKRQQ